MWHASWGGLPAPEFLEAVDPLLGLFRGHLYPIIAMMRVIASETSGPPGWD